MQPTFQLQQCPIFLGSLHGFADWFRSRNYSKVLVLADDNTARFCLPVFLKNASFEHPPECCVIPAGEGYKTLQTCEQIWAAMLHAQLDRKALLINLGGGVVGDMGGFCAATWKRGVDFVQIPTTLLAMTDAAIGGKTGIDFQGVKNVIGVFQQPVAVFVEPQFLATLPERELRSGLAEVIKHAVISGQKFEHLNSVRHRDEAWLKILESSIAVKVRIVAEDPLEQGIRKLLNFGHSIGHALESYFLETEHPITHGEAVAIGMICELPPSPLRAALMDTLRPVFGHQNIPVSAFPRIWELMLQDKKNEAGQVNMAVPAEQPFALRMEKMEEAVLVRRLAGYNGLGC